MSVHLTELLEPLVTAVWPDPHDQQRLLTDLTSLADTYAPALAARTVPELDERSAFLITYGDAVRTPGQAPLATLRTFLEQVGPAISDVHLLPMFPWTSDDGFAVTDHRQIDPQLGTWHDVDDLGANHGLMFDFIANHVSSASPWFTGWLAQDDERAGYFLSPGPEFDTTHVVRPRTTPLMHDYLRSDGTAVHAWTTFGPDQVDLDLSTPAVMLELTDILLGYIAHGADTVRLDAIGYLWKNSGSSCLHQDQTHTIIKIWRAMLDHLVPGARLLTETNVPHAENISYLGNGRDEAHMVYQFALPPLVLHSFVSGDATRLTRWATDLVDPGTHATWFNFLASHDGIGMRPANGLLTEAEQAALVNRAERHGGRVSYASQGDGPPTVYELNVSYLDALTEPERADDPDHAVKRALAAHGVLLSIAGVPAIYYHSLVGSSHDIASAVESGINRRINRARLDAEQLRTELVTSERRRGIYQGLVHMLTVRRTLPAFSPFAAQEVLDLGPQVFAVRRGSGTDTVTAVINVSGTTVELKDLHGRDLLTGTVHSAVTLPADAVVWLVDR